jgi:hypothetical protein
MWFYRPEQLPALAGMVVTGFLIKAPALTLSQYKDLSRTLALPEAHFTAQRPYGLVQAVASPALRYAPDVSLTYAGTIAVRDALFTNGDWFGAVPLWPPKRAATIQAATRGRFPMPWTSRAGFWCSLPAPVMMHPHALIKGRNWCGWWNRIVRQLPYLARHTLKAQGQCMTVPG